MTRRWTLLGVASTLILSSAAAAAGPDAAAVRGKAVYDQACVSCHGVYGRGDGPALEYFKMKPPDFTDPAVLAGRSDEEIVKGLLTRGSDPKAAHSPMAIASVLKPEALHDAVHYIHGMAVPGKHVSVAAGRDIYMNVCWACHGINGDGQGPAAKNLGETKPRDFTSPKFSIAGREEEVYKTISEGAAASFHGSTAMPSWSGSLTPQQIRDVMAYVATFQPKAH